MGQQVIYTFEVFRTRGTTDGIGIRLDHKDRAIIPEITMGYLGDMARELEPYYNPDDVTSIMQALRVTGKASLCPSKPFLGSGEVTFIFLRSFHSTMN